MKKVIWIVALIALIGTAAVLSFLPETVPVHFDAAWNADRWGSRLELLLLPVLLLPVSALWMVILNAIEKKAAGADEEKARENAGTNRRALGIMAVSLNVMLTLVQAWLLYQVHRAAEPGGEAAGAALDRLPFILMGLLFIVLGNLMPKTRRNAVVGIRTAKSMYNDDTWRRTNRFGGYAMVIAGILTVLAAALVTPPLAATVIVLVLVAAALIATLVYSGRVYTEEKERSESHEE